MGFLSSRMARALAGAAESQIGTFGVGGDGFAGVNERLEGLIVGWGIRHIATTSNLDG